MSGCREARRSEETSAIAVIKGKVTTFNATQDAPEVDSDAPFE